jgi:hypothetical protein
MAMPTGANVLNFGQSVAQPTATGDLGKTASECPPARHGDHADQRDEDPDRDERVDDPVQRALGEVEREGTARWAATARFEGVKHDHVLLGVAAGTASDAAGELEMRMAS